jgi:hypothetical protein
VCDVFTDTPLTGYQLAVFTDAREAAVRRLAWWTSGAGAEDSLDGAEWFDLRAPARLLSVSHRHLPVRPQKPEADASGNLEVDVLDAARGAAELHQALGPDRGGGDHHC